MRGRVHAGEGEVREGEGGGVSPGDLGNGVRGGDRSPEAPDGGCCGDGVTRVRICLSDGAADDGGAGARRARLGGVVGGGGSRDRDGGA